MTATNLAALMKILMTVLIMSVMMTACSKPGVDGLRESFAQQLAANRFVKDFTLSGDELRFSGPDVQGGVANWRVRIDSAAIESNTDPGKPYKGVVKSSWYSNDQLITPRGSDSNLPLELTSTGLAQDCWALWNEAAGKWEWE